MSQFYPLPSVNSYLTVIGRGILVILPIFIIIIIIIIYKTPAPLFIIFFFRLGFLFPSTLFIFFFSSADQIRVFVFFKLSDHRTPIWICSIVTTNTPPQPTQLYTATSDWRVCLEINVIHHHL
ncbi:hypothetical protein HanPI659440_Chr01g0008051 [Helianthus annuus]|nr:hypothetical protein HanPI659440_Chr01g0008051 [Helianthus annuus]